MINADEGKPNHALKLERVTATGHITDLLAIDLYVIPTHRAGLGFEIIQQKSQLMPFHPRRFDTTQRLNPHNVVGDVKINIAFQPDFERVCIVVRIPAKRQHTAFDPLNRAWVAGADAYYAIPARGMSLGADTITAQHPVVAMVFGQSGLIAGAAIEGTKYTRVIPSSLGI